MQPTPGELASFAKEKAVSLGFDLCGITGALPRGQREFYEWWVDQGYSAGMAYLRAQKRRRFSIEKILPGAKSVLLCAQRIPPGAVSAPEDLGKRAYGKLARYSLHADYHAQLLPRLGELAMAIDGAAGTTRGHFYVDTGPISERAFGALAGVGWIGKHSLLINKELGSWLWLGVVITRASLQPDEPVADHCGKCRRCLDACPTGAILEDIRAVDARKCLSYWNIEHKGSIPEAFHKPMGDWLVGCDICQEVCPWNAQSERKGRPLPSVEYVAADEILEMTEEEFLARFQGRALERAGLAGLQRNAKIVKANHEN